MLRSRPFNRIQKRLNPLRLLTAASVDTAPTSLVFSNITTTSLTLGWDSVTPTPDYYQVQRKLTSQDATHWTTIGTPASATIDDSGLTQDESYDYQVAAHDAAGLGPYSSAATVVTLPGAPQDLIASNITTTTITVTGAQNSSDGSAAVTYEFQRKLTSQGSGSWATVATPSTPIFADTGLTQNESYDYRYREKNNGGTQSGAWSNTLTQVTLPGAPRSMNASSVTSTSMTIGWSQALGDGSATGHYILERRVTGVDPYVQIYSGTTANFPDSGLTQGTSYDYRAAEVNAGGQGAYSSVLTQATTNPPGKPRNVKGTPGHNHISVAFDPPSSGGTPTSYTLHVTPHSGGSTVTFGGASSPIDATGLTDGTGYDLQVDATNADGTGPLSDLTGSDNTNVVPNFFPESLSPVFYFDINRSNKWQNSGRTTPAVALNDPVYVWDNNLGINSTNAIRAASTSGKLLDAGNGHFYMGSNAGGNYAEEFDIAASLPFSHDGSNTVNHVETWALVKAPAAGQTSGVLRLSSAGGQFGEVFFGGPGTFYWNDYFATQRGPITVSVSAGDWCIVRMQSGNDGSTSKLWVYRVTDAMPETPSDTGATGSEPARNPLQLGNSAYGNPIPSKAYLMFDGFLSAGNAALLDAYLKNAANYA